MNATLDLDHLSKLAEATMCCNEGVGWFDATDFRSARFTDEDFIAFLAAATPATVQELIRLARLGMEKET